MEVATGGLLLRTMWTVAGEGSRCLAGILSVAGPVNAGRFSFCRHRAPREWMCNMCQQLHSFCWSGAYEEYAGSERYEIKMLLRNYKLWTNRSQTDDIVARLSN
jgi:hypothetical protein